MAAPRVQVLQLIAVGAGVLLLIIGIIVVSYDAPAPASSGETSLYTSSGLSLGASDDVATATPQSGERYTTTRYGFSVRLPNGYAAERFDEGDGAHTFVFSGATSSPSFQVYVEPLDGEQTPVVTPKLLSRQFPDLPKAKPQEVTLDGRQGLAFLSRTDEIGETREVWVAAKGRLYQITTARQHDRWLARRIQSWQFLERL